MTRLADEGTEECRVARLARREPRRAHVTSHLWPEEVFDGGYRREGLYEDNVGRILLERERCAFGALEPKLERL